MSAVVRVEVEVFEDGERVGHIDIAYFPGQPYRVELVTPDGKDDQVARTAGEAA